jgi:hypothetical protein
MIRFIRALFTIFREFGRMVIEEAEEIRRSR